MTNDLPRLSSCVDQPDNYTLGFTMVTIQHCADSTLLLAVSCHLRMWQLHLARWACVRPVLHVEVQRQQHH